MVGSAGHSCCGCDGVVIVTAFVGNDDDVGAVPFDVSGPPLVLLFSVIINIV